MSSIVELEKHLANQLAQLLGAHRRDRRSKVLSRWLEGRTVPSPHRSAPTGSVDSVVKRELDLITGRPGARDPPPGSVLRFPPKIGEAILSRQAIPRRDRGPDEAPEPLGIEE
jgi:hypothetical protein